MTSVAHRLRFRAACGQGLAVSENSPASFELFAYSPAPACYECGDGRKRVAEASELVNERMNPALPWFGHRGGVHRCSRTRRLLDRGAVGSSPVVVDAAPCAANGCGVGHAVTTNAGRVS